MRARLLVTFTLMLGSGCTDGAGPLETQRPSIRVEERFGQLVLINDWHRPVYAMVADVRHGEDFGAQLCVVQECVEVGVDDAHAFDVKAILGGRETGSVRVFTWGTVTLPSPDAPDRGPVNVIEVRIDPLFFR